MHLYFVRHLPTNWNQQGKLQGHKDIEIRSCNVISSVKAKLDKTTFDSIYCSDLIRTQQTAKCYGFDYYEIDKLLKELDFGHYEGRGRSDLTRAEEDWLHAPFRTTLKNYLEEMELRIDSFLSKIVQKNKVLVFGHGAWGRLLRAKYEYKNKNLMNTFEIKGGAMFDLIISGK